jgi:predicted TIM-barrel fold metal-dependent hydrolase
MEMRRAIESLIEAMEEFEIIDCHEHLKPEGQRLRTPVDVFTLFSHYTACDLENAGMPETDFQRVANLSLPPERRWVLFDQRIPLHHRWQMFKPYWEEIRWGSYARAALLAAERFYGFDDISDATYGPLSEAIQAANQPGLYERVLRGACNIRTALTQCNTTDTGTPLLTPVMPLVSTAELDSWEGLSHPSFDPNAIIRSLDDYLDAVRTYIVRVKSEGAVGMKLWCWPYGTPCREEAVSAFERLHRGGASHASGPGQSNPLLDYVVDQAIGFAAQQDLVIAVHTGYWDDFRLLDPLHMIPILQRHPRARFDIYHLGFPWGRETLMLGKGFPNVWLNLCWTHVISQRFVVSALDEAIDLIPANKILAFGGDYGIPVEKVYGHLVMAREDIAEVLARRILEGRMSEAQALGLARKWFWTNPIELYRLEL